MRIGVLGTGRLGSFRAHILGEPPAVEEVILGGRTVERTEDRRWWDPSKTLTERRKS